MARLRQAGRSGVGQFRQPAVQDVVVDAMVSSDRGDRHAGNAASSDQLGYELEAVGTTATAGLGGWFLVYMCPLSVTWTRYS